MQGEFPKEDTVTIRLHASEKDKAKRIPFSYYEIFKCGLEHLSKEINQLEERKAVIELKLADMDEVYTSLTSELTRINNRIRIINPERLDKSVLDAFLDISAKEYAEEVYKSQGDKCFERIEKFGKSSILKAGRDKGYDGTVFYDKVIEYLHDFCNTEV